MAGYFLGDLSSDRKLASRADVLAAARRAGASFRQVSTDGQGVVRVLLRPSEHAAAIGGAFFHKRADADAFCKVAGSQVVHAQIWGR
jgi:hypothetical protein